MSGSKYMVEIDGDQVDFLVGKSLKEQYENVLEAIKQNKQRHSKDEDSRVYTAPWVSFNYDEEKAHLKKMKNSIELLYEYFTSEELTKGE